MPYVFWQILDFEITGEDFDEVDQLFCSHEESTFILNSRLISWSSKTS
jgi:hypothetical protein